jgi:colicin import membrane protein
VVIVDSGTEEPQRVCAGCVASLAEIVARDQAEVRMRAARAKEEAEARAQQAAAQAAAAAQAREAVARERAAEARACKDAALSEQWHQRQLQEAAQQSLTPEQEEAACLRKAEEEAAAGRKAAGEEAAALASVRELLDNPSRHETFSTTIQPPYSSTKG